MERISVAPRADKAEQLESIGLSFHGWDKYWNEDVCFKFTAAEVDELESVTAELHHMAKQAVKLVINENRFSELQIPERFWQPITESFQRDEFSLYGRFDLAYDGKSPPKMLEYNADTPTSLLESAVAQWYWMEQKFPGTDQFNSLHDKLVAKWKTLHYDTIYFASLSENEEDWVCVHYMMETVVQAGKQAKHIYLEDVGYDPVKQCFVDVEGNQIHVLFKLYPWEWMMRESFAQYLPCDKTRFIEPMWKAVLSNKGILAIMWEMYRDHPNLLPTYTTPRLMPNYAKKPLFSREGANIELVRNGQTIAKDDGPYGAEGYVYQQLHELPNFDGYYPILGSWVVGDEPAGICVREDSLLITTNMSNFIPHYFTE